MTTSENQNESLEPQKPIEGQEGTAQKPEEKMEAEKKEQAQEAIAESIEESPGTSEPVEDVKPQASVEQTPDASAESTEDENEEEEEEDALEILDFEKASTEEMANYLEQASNTPDIKLLGNILRAAQPVINELKDQIQKAALATFVEAGGEEGDFEMNWDEHIQRIDANVRLMRDRRGQHIRQEEDRRHKNLQQKEALLDKLRHLVDGEESTASHKAIKDIQDEWKSVGQVPGMRNGELWASYKALMDRYYDQRSILNELKELDRRKNLEQKIEICEKAEKLADLNDVRIAIRALNDLHEEFKHIGPIPQEEQDKVWDRFRAASDVVYQRRRAYQDVVKTELNENLKKKEALVEKAEGFAQFNSDRIKEWNTKTKELQHLQKEWETIGGLPRNKSKEVNKSFWAAFKSFFQNKGKFFKSLETEREENLKRKQELVAQAEALSQSNDFQGAAVQLKALQSKWREIGPVPEKVRDSIYKNFKKACDTFFERKRAQGKAYEAEYVENLKQKESLCEEILVMAKTGAGTLEQLQSYVNKWSAIGYVPKESIGKVQRRYDEALEAYSKSMDGVSADDVKEAKMKVELFKLKADPDANRKLNQKEVAIRKKISAVENEIALWRNNMEFFTTSVKADKLLKDFEKKIQEAENEIEDLKKQLSVLKDL